MYTWPVRIPLPRRRARGATCACGRKIWRILSAPAMIKHHLVMSLRGAISSPASDARRRNPPRITRSLRAPKLHQTVALIFTYEDDIKIKNKHDTDISWTFYLAVYVEIISRPPPQSRETIPVRPTQIL
jgi:hypothetical protein